MKSRPSKRPQPSFRAKPKSAPPPRTVEVEVEEIGARGDGVARLGGEMVFVPFTVPGDKVVARVEGRRGDGLAAALVEVLVPGEGRAEPACPHFSRCGGCSLQHVDDALYGEWKRGLLATQLARAGLGDVPVDALVRVPPGGRRRAAFAFSRRKGQTLLGFNARASHAVVDVERCLLLEPALMALLPPLRAMLADIVADGEDGDVVVAMTETGADVLVEADARLDLFDRERLAAFADAQDLARLSWRRPGAGFVDPIARRRPAVVRFGGVAVEPAPGGFLQPTKGGELAIADAVLAAVGTAQVVADLYSGCGSFTLPLAGGGRAVHAVEGEEAPIRALEAAVNNVQNLRVTTEVRDLARRPLLAHELKKFQAVVFDPPRAGASAQAEQLAEGGPAVVVAVSCNPATLARDLKILRDGGYVIEGVTPIDQFPFSAHLEAVAVCRR
ncbi:MAG TPA: class I SAM-dependent RNA methyltransferase [Magnetospirillum sp.]|jgi:23S rRNA (uracil1939-C5)-methyltransferase|nr:class I SAM-dependent RNA methyltransferase [Magnetospirillum sp.]